MTWAISKRAQHGMALTDGYLVAGVAEQSVADKVLGRLRGSRSPAPRNRFPEFAQVWVVGSNGWIVDASEPFRSLAENERRDDYRVVICRYSLSPQRMPYAFSPSAATYAGGLRPQKHHPSRPQFRERAAVVMNALSDCLEEAPAEPLRLFNQLGVPCVFSGESRSLD